MVKGFIDRANRRSMALVGCESIFITGAVTLSAYVLVGDHVRPIFNSSAVLWRSLLIAFVCQLCLYYADVYEFGITADRRELLARILKALGGSLMILAALYFQFPKLVIGHGVVSMAALLAVALVIGWRLAFVWMAKSLAPRKRLLIIGTSPTAISFARELEGRDELGVEIVGFVDPDASASGTSPARVIGSIEDIPAIVRARSVDRVVVSLADARGKLPMSTLLQMKLDGVTFDHLASVYEEYTGKIAVENLRPSWLIFADGFRKSRGHAIVKRVTDVCFAAAALIVLFPVLLLVALAVRLTSQGPILYHQRRVGQGDDRRGLGEEGRRADHPARRVHATVASRRAAAALEHPLRPHERRRSASRASRIRRRAAATDSLLRPTPCRQARTDRMGAGPVHLRRERRRRDGEAPVRPVLHQAHVDRARRSHHAGHCQDGAAPEGRLTWTPSTSSMR